MPQRAAAAAAAALLLLVAFISLPTVIAVGIGGGGGGALRFDGKGAETLRESFVVMNEVPGLVDEFTIEFWATACHLDDQLTFVNLESPEGASFEISYHNSFLGILWARGSWDSLPKFTDRTHVAYTTRRISADSSEIRGYINGNLHSSINTTTAVELKSADAFVSTRWFIGIRSRRLSLATVQERGHCGTMDEFRLWRTARPQSDIQRDMNRVIPASEVSTAPEYADLVTYLSFDETDGGLVAQNSADPVRKGLFGLGSADEAPVRIDSTFPLGGSVLRLRGRQDTDIAIPLRGRRRNCVGDVATCEGADIAAKLQQLPAVGEVFQADASGAKIGAALTSVPVDVSNAARMLVFTPPPGTTEQAEMRYSLCDDGACDDDTHFNVSVTVQANAAPVAGRAYMLKLDGQDDFVSLTDFLMDEEFTIEFMLQPFSARDGQALIGKHTSVGKNIFNFGFYQGGYHLNIRDNTFTGAFDAETPGKLLPQRLSIVCRADNAQSQTHCTLYRDAIELWTHTFTNLLGDTVGVPWALGQEYDGGPRPSDFLSGLMDDVRFWNRARTQGEIAADMHRLLEGSEADLVVYLRCDEGTGERVYNRATAAGANSRAADPERAFPTYGTFVAGVTWTQSTFPIKGSDVEVSVLEGSSVDVVLEAFDQDDAADGLRVELVAATLPSTDLLVLRWAGPDGTAAIDALPSTAPDSAAFTLVVNSVAGPGASTTNIGYRTCDYLVCSDVVQVRVRVLVEGPVITAVVADDPDDADDVFGAGDTLTIEFNTDTDQPTVDSQQEVDALFRFHPRIHAKYVGEWLTPARCRISIVSLLTADTSPALPEGATAHIAPASNLTVSVVGTLINARGTSQPSSSVRVGYTGDFGLSEADDTWKIAVGVAVPCGLLLLVLLAVMQVLRRRHRSALAHATRWKIPFEELEFEREIGRGSFGFVCSGRWRGTKVAIKALHSFNVSTFANNSAQVECNALNEYRTLMLTEVERSGGHSSSGGANNSSNRNLRSSGNSNKDELRKAIKDFESEIDIMVQLRHPNIVLFMGACVGENLAIVQELLTGTVTALFDRSDFLFTWQTRLGIAIDCARGMLFLHSHNPPILHLDLKSPNLLHDDKMKVKIADFGLTGLKGTHKDKQMVGGSILWMGPELLQYGAAAVVSEKADVFAFGVVLVELCNRRLPWFEMQSSAGKLPRVLSRVVAGRRCHLDPATNAGVRVLIEACCATECNKRPDFGGILRTMEEFAAECDEWAPLNESSQSVAQPEPELDAVGQAV